MVMARNFLPSFVPGRGSVYQAMDTLRDSTNGSRNPLIEYLFILENGQDFLKTRCGRGRVLHKVSIRGGVDLGTENEGGYLVSLTAKNPCAGIRS